MKRSVVSAQLLLGGESCIIPGRLGIFLFQVFYGSSFQLCWAKRKLTLTVPKERGGGGNTVNCSRILNFISWALNEYNFEKNGALTCQKGAGGTDVYQAVHEPAICPCSPKSQPYPIFYPGQLHMYFWSGFQCKKYNFQIFSHGEDHCQFFFPIGLSLTNRPWLSVADFVNLTLHISPIPSLCF